MIGLTICSNNYLALAKTLAESWTATHPGARFVIGLVDAVQDSIDYILPQGAALLPVADLQIEGFGALASKYNVTELCTAVKPRYLEWALAQPDGEKVFYVDPDIVFFRRMEEAERLLDSAAIVLTPHICSPLDGDLGPNDYHLLRGGVFNLGFLGLARGKVASDLLRWWGQRMTKYAYRCDADGLFYDQVWMNYIPTFTDSYRVLRDLGYNVANWNLHERAISERDGQFWVNDHVPLTFFHFSNYRLETPETIASYNHRVSFGNRPDVKPLFDLYRERVLAHGHSSVTGVPGVYQRPTRPGGCIPPADGEEIVLRFSPRLAPLIRGRSWHTTQRLLDLPSGEVEMRLRPGATEDIDRMILGCGEHVRVVSPASKAAAIASRLQSAARHYPGSPS